jgi:hypothetical protein
VSRLRSVCSLLSACVCVCVCVCPSASCTAANCGAAACGLVFVHLADWQSGALAWGRWACKNGLPPRTA